MVRRPLVVAGIAVAVVLAGGIALVALKDDKPEALEELERAQEAGEEAQANSRAIVANLEAIVANLRSGTGLSSKSSKIHDLTVAQRRSLENLIGLLRSQLAALRRSSELVETTEESTTGLARLSIRETRRLARAVDALENLRDLAAEAGATSADLARAALYGARLAEDSQKSFKP